MPARYSYAIIGQDSLQSVMPSKRSQSLDTTYLVHVSAHKSKGPPLADISYPCGHSLAEGRNSSVRVPSPLKASHPSVQITCPVVPQLHMGDIPPHQSHLPLLQRNCVLSCAVLTGFVLPRAHQESGFSFRIQSTFSEVSLIKSRPVEGLSPTSIQQTGDLHGLPYKAS